MSPWSCCNLETGSWCRGEIVAVDGTVGTGVAVLDQSVLTGEALPIQQHAGEAVLSGSTNAGDSFGVSARAEASTYADIVRLVEAAQPRWTRRQAM